MIFRDGHTMWNVFRCLAQGSGHRKILQVLPYLVIPEDQRNSLDSDTSVERRIVPTVHWLRHESLSHGVPTPHGMHAFSLCSSGMRQGKTHRETDTCKTGLLEEDSEISMHRGNHERPRVIAKSKGEDVGCSLQYISVSLNAERRRGNAIVDSTDGYHYCTASALQDYVARDSAR